MEWRQLESNAKAVIAKVSKNEGTGLRLEQEFIKFEERFRGQLTANVAKNVTYFFEWIRKRGLATSTIATYTKAFIPYFKRRWPEDSMEEFHKYIAGIKLEVMSSHVRHAPDIDMNCAFEIIDTTRVLAIKIDIWLLAVTGGRYADLQRCKKIIMMPETGVLFVNWGPMKNRRNAMHQVSNSYSIPAQLAKFDFIAKLPTMTTYCDDKPTHSSYSSILARLKKYTVPQHLRNSKVQYNHITSYSFRRLFIQSAIDINTNESGKIDWDAVCQLTNHKEGCVINATYRKNPTHPTVKGEEAETLPSSRNLANEFLMEMSKCAAEDTDEDIEMEIPELFIDDDEVSP